MEDARAATTAALSSDGGANCEEEAPRVIVPALRRPPSPPWEGAEGGVIMREEGERTTAEAEGVAEGCGAAALTCCDQGDTTV